MVKFKDFSKPFLCFSSTFQGNLNFQGLFKSPVNSSTFQACAIPVDQIKYYAIRNYLNYDFMQCLSTKLGGSVSN